MTSLKRAFVSSINSNRSKVTRQLIINQEETETDAMPTQVIAKTPTDRVLAANVVREDSEACKVDNRVMVVNVGCKLDSAGCNKADSAGWVTAIRFQHPVVVGDARRQARRFQSSR